MGTMIWNGKRQSSKGTIIEDIINGFWKVSEDVYYDNLASKMDDMKYVDTTPNSDDDQIWFTECQADSDNLLLS